MMEEHINIRRKNCGAAILSRREIDSLAFSIVSDYCSEMNVSPRPLDIMGLVNDYIKAPLTTENIYRAYNVLGATRFERTEDSKIRGTIVIDSELFEDESQSGRCRFTIGHECGHYLFHGPYYMNITAQVENHCDPIKPGKFRTDRDWAEWQANAFASSLLMPETAVRILCDNYNDIGDENLKTALIIVCTAGTFDVSFQAAIVRLRELKILDRYRKIPYEEMNFVSQFNTGLRMRRKYLS